jgi:hypothetical protein
LQNLLQRYQFPFNIPMARPFLEISLETISLLAQSREKAGESIFGRYLKLLRNRLGPSGCREAKSTSPSRVACPRHA